MSTDTPPFDPPYVSIHPAEQGVTYSKTLADGTTRSLSAAEANWMEAGEADPVTAQLPKASNPAQSTGASHKQSKVFLKVPYAEKDAAKALGARWDATQKKWYVPPGVDVQLFSQWLQGV